MINTSGHRILKYKKAPKPTPAEIRFKEIHDETKWMIDTMGKDPSNTGQKRS